MNKKLNIIFKFIIIILFVININLFYTEKASGQNIGKFLEQIYIVDSKELVLEEEIIDVNVKTGKVACKYTISNPLKDVIKTKIKFPIPFFDIIMYNVYKWQKRLT